jgi:ABC-type transport system substrate-binding protein
MVFYGLTSQIRGFDPVKAGDVSSSMAISKVYEGLLQYAYLARPYRVEPALAERMPDISADGLVYTFRVRPGIFYQDDPCFAATGGKGRELAAEDFVYALKRTADLKNESTGYWAFNDRIVGLDEFRDKSAGEAPTDYDAPVEGLRATDRRTLVITLKRPYPQLLWVLAMHYAFAIPREAVERYGADFLNHPVGTGPFRLKAWTRDYRIEFERSPKWAETGRVETYPTEGEPDDAAKGLLDDAGKPIPFLDRIVQYVIDDPSTQWLKFVTGETESSGISRDNWDAVISKHNDLNDALRRMGVRLESSPTLDVYYLGFNMDDPVVGQGRDAAESLRHRKLRQALSCAFNSEEWVKFYNGRIVRAKGPIPPGVAGYDEKPSPYPFDLAKARALLAEAGYPDGVDAATGKRLQLTVEIGSGADPDVRQSEELMADFARQIGVVVQTSYNNWPTFLGKMERRQSQLFRLGWVADYPDAENFLQLFYGPNSSPGPNHVNYSNPEFDRLYEQVRTMPDSPERTALYRKMADIVIEDSPWIYMHHPMSHGLHHHWLKNYKEHDFPYGMVKYVRIDANARSEWRATHGRGNWQSQ